MERRIGLGFIGCGEVGGEKHLPAVREVPELQVVAVADRDPECLRSAKERHRIAAATGYHDPAALLADPRVEVVAVCLPPTAQVAVAIEALDAGKHVWIEAPIGLSMPDCDRLIAKAETSKGRVTVGFHMRWHRLVRETKRLIRDGRLGQIQSIRATWNSPRDDDTLPEWRRYRAQGGGALVEVATDHYDLWRYLLDAEIAELFASTVDGRWEDEAAVVAGHMTSGVLVSAVFSERANHDLEIEICGKAGRVRASLIRFEGLEYYPTEVMPSSPAARLGRIGHFLRELPRALPRMHRAGDYRVSYRDHWRQFVRTIRSGEPIEATLQDGRQALAAVLAGVHSSVVGRPVTPREAPGTITLRSGPGRVRAGG